jgi:two-component system, NarL family, sensor histidine kinase BarA
MYKPVILVVEDDPVLRTLTRRQVMQFEYACQTASSGEEAVVSNCSAFDLIFMDIGLPGIDGITATMMIRERAKTRQKTRAHSWLDGPCRVRRMQFGRYG